MIDMTDLFVSLYTRAQFSISPVRCENGVLTHKQTSQVRTELFDGIVAITETNIAGYFGSIGRSAYCIFR